MCLIVSGMNVGVSSIRQQDTVTIDTSQDVASALYNMRETAARTVLEHHM